MKRPFSCIAAVLLSIPHVAWTQSVTETSLRPLTRTSSESESAGKESDGVKFAALLGYNFTGKGDVSNLTPELFFGFDESLNGKGHEPGTWAFRFGPTFSSGPDATDSSNVFRSLMLPGNASISGLLYRVFAGPHGIAGSTYYLSGGAGLKVVSTASDTVPAIVQHNLRAGAGFQLRELFLLGAQYTWGWHNLTNESETAFRKVFGTDQTAVQYLLVSVQSRLTEPADSYLFLSWRNSTKVKPFESYAQSRRVVSIGIRKDFGIPAANPVR